ncbi:hypothetical protein ACFX13_004375 [Malus domestica]
MRALMEEATSLGMLTEFNLISEPVTPSLLTRENLDLREGEALFINSIMHLRTSRGSIFADEVRNIVTFEGSNRIERPERADQWRRQLGRAGFQETVLKCTSQARMMLSVYGCDGYTLASEKGCFLRWKGRPKILASAWQARSLSSS